MKVNPTAQVSIRFNPSRVQWYLQETVKESPVAFRVEQISPDYGSLDEVEFALAALLEVYDSAAEAESEGAVSRPYLFAAETV